MKVLAINYSDQGGGAEEFALSLSLTIQGTTLLVRHKKTGSRNVKELPLNFGDFAFNYLNRVIWKLGIKTSFRSFFGFQNSRHRTYKTLSKLPEYKEADIIHLHNIHGEYFDLKCLNKILNDKPIVWTSHDMWLNTGGEGGIYKNMTDIERRNSYPLKGGFIDERKKQIQIKKRILSLPKRLIVVAPSYDHQKNILNVHPKANVRQIYNGIDLKKFNTENRNQDTGTRNLLIFNTSSNYKNSNEVLNILKKVKYPYNLHVLGEDLIDSEFQKTVNHGYILDRQKLASLFKTIDISIFSSKAETLGLLPIELAACGAKVFLNYSLPVFKEHHDLYEATLFKNEEDLVNKLNESILNIEQSRKEGEKAALQVQQKLNIEDTANKYKMIYRELLSTE